MPIVGTAEILIVANDSKFERSLRDGVAPGFSGVKKDAETAGTGAGDALAMGLGSGGKRGGDQLRRGVKDGVDGAKSDVAKGGTDLVDNFTNHISGALGGLSGLFGAVGLDLHPLQEGVDRTSQKFAAAKGTGNDLMGVMTGLGRATAVASVAGFGAMAAGSLKMTESFQAATAQMAASANIPMQAAQNIGKAFTKEGPGIINSAQEQMAAYGQVAGQLGAVQGHALSTGEAVEFMRHSMDLAEETGNTLGNTTSDLSQIMQTFQIPLAKTGETTAQLFNASRLTNVSVDSLTQTMDRLKARLGVAAPTVGDLSALIVDLGEHGVTGSRGLMVVNTAINTLLQSTGKLDAAQQKAADAEAKKVTTAKDDVAKATLTLQVAEQKQADSAGKSATAQATAAAAVAKAKLGLSQAQQKLTDAESSGAAIGNANVAALSKLGITVYDAQGKFVGMRDVIAQLQPKLKGLTQEQQLQALSSVFGASASKSLLDVVLAGPGAYDKASKSVNDTAAAHNALAAQQKTVQHELESAKVDVQNLAVTFGTWLLPKVKDALDGLGAFVRFLDEHKPVLYAFAAVVGTVLVASLLVWIYTVGTKMVRATKDAVNGISGLFKKGDDQAAKSKQQAVTNEQSARRTTTSWEEASSSVGRSADQIETSLGQIGSVMERVAGQIEAAVGQIEASLSTLAADTEADLTAADGAWAELGASAEAAAAEVATASANIEADDAAVAEASAGSKMGGLGGAGKVGKVGGALTAVTAGVAAYQMTSQALNSNFLGSGSAVKSASTAVGNFLGVGPQQAYSSTMQSTGGTSSDVTFLESIASGQVKDAVISASDAKSQLHTLGIPGYDAGGWVHGAPGSAVLAMVHAGEYILSRDDLAHMGVGRNMDVAKALTSFDAGTSSVPSRFAPGQSNLPGRSAAAPGRQVVIAEGAVKQVFNTPMSAPAVANEVGWALRTAATSGGRLKV